MGFSRNSVLENIEVKNIFGNLNSKNSGKFFNLLRPKYSYNI